MKPTDLINFLIWTIGIFFLIGVVLLVAAALTGQTRRAYQVISPDEFVVIQDQKISVQSLAESYQPLMHLRNSTPSPPLLWVYYEAVAAEKTIDLVYYYVWENEVNPEPGIDKAYWLFRAAYFGYPVRDIEFLQVKVDRQTGEVAELFFETSPGDNFFVTFSLHIRARYLRQPDGSYLEIRADRSDAELSRQAGVEVLFNDQRALVLAQTWNHLTRLLFSDDQDVSPVDAPLKYLTEPEYRAYKFCRKSQGDYQTQESPYSIPIAAAAVMCFTVIPLVILRRLKKPKV